jgi:hypothetical protein
MKRKYKKRFKRSGFTVQRLILNTVIRKNQVYWILWERLSSRDRLNSRLEAAPTGVFFSLLALPDKRNTKSEHGENWEIGSDQGERIVIKCLGISTIY